MTSKFSAGVVRGTKREFVDIEKVLENSLEDDLNLLYYPENHLKKNIKPITPKARDHFEYDPTDEKAPYFLKHALSVLKSPSHIIESSEAEHSGTTVLEPELDVTKLPVQYHDIDTVPKKRKARVDDKFTSAVTISLTKLDKNLIENQNSEFRKHLEISENRHHIFNLQTFNNIIPTESRTTAPSPPETERLLNRLRIRVSAVNIGYGEEPFFCSTFIYDLKKHRMVTEPFYFSPNDKYVCSLVNQDYDSITPFHKCKDFTIELLESSTDYYLLTFVTRVFQGETKSMLDPQTKMTTKEQARIKYSEQLRLYCSKVSQFQQIVGFSWYRLFSGSGHLAADFNHSRGNLAAIVPLVEKPHDPLSQLTEKSLKGLKAIPKASLEFDFEYLSSEVLQSGVDLNEKLHDPELIYVDTDYRTRIADNHKELEIDISPKTQLKFARQLTELPYEDIPSTLLPSMNSLTNNLYIQFESLNLSSTDGRSIAIYTQLLPNDSKVQDAEGLAAFYGRWSTEPFISKPVTSVTFHNKKPNFFDILKVKLPINLTKSYHLLFTFVHVSLDFSKQKKGSMRLETVLGYAILPLYPGGRIIPDKQYHLPVATAIAPGHLANPSSIKYLDKEKPLFKLSTKLHSTVFTQDNNLDVFFHQYDALKVQENTPEVFKGKQFPELSLSHANPKECLHYFPVLMIQLFDLLTTYQEHRVFQGILDVLSNVRSLANNDEEFYRSPALASFLTTSPFSFEDEENSAKAPLYEILTKGWLDTLNDEKKKPVQSEPTSPNEKSKKGSEKTKTRELERVTPIDFKRDGTWLASGFLFGCIYRSLFFSLEKQNQLDMRSSRQATFKNFRSILSDLCQEIIEQILVLTKQEQTRAAKIVNDSLGFFLKDLFNIYDRTLIFNILEMYIKHITHTGKSNLALRTELKYRLLSIVSDSPFYIPLNLPFPIDKDLIKSWDKSSVLHQFSQSHYMAGLLMNEFDRALAGPASERSYGLLPLRNVLRRHALDSRYQKPEQLERVMTIYFPILLICTQKADTIKTFEEKEDQLSVVCSFLFTLKHCDRSLVRKWLQSIPKEMCQRFISVLHLCIQICEYSGEFNIREEFTHTREFYNYQNKSVSTSQRKNMIETRYRQASTSKLERKGSTDPESPLKATEELAKDRTLRNSGGERQNVRAFARVRGESKGGISKKDSMADSTGSVESTPTTPKRGSLDDSNSSVTSESTPRFRDFKSGKSFKSVSSNSDMRASKEDPRNSISWKGSLRIHKLGSTRNIDVSDLGVILSGEQYVSREAILTILDMLYDFSEDFISSFEKESSHLLSSVFKVVCSILNRRTSRACIIATVEFLRLLVFRVPGFHFGFKTGANDATDVVRRLIQLSNTKDKDIRSTTGAMLYVLLRTNYEQRSNLALSKLRIALSISEMAGKVTDSDTPPPDFDHLESVLLALATQASDDSTPFEEDVNTLQKRLGTVIAQSEKLYRYRHDPEMTAEIYHQISLGYTDSPELRVTWMKHLSDYYQDREQNEEAAHCILFIANLIIEYMNLGGENQLGFPKNRQELASISPNVVREPELAFQKGEEHIFAEFSKKALINHLKNAIAYLEKDQLWESCIFTYNILINVYQVSKQYNELSEGYSHLSQITKRLAAGETRVFSAFYRVGFYGKLFKSLNGKEFIYKAVRGTLLSTFNEQIQKQLSEQFDDDTKVVLLSNLKEIDKSALMNDKSTAYFQVISVQPYDKAIGGKAEDFSATFNNDTFFLEIPFTKKEGVAQSEDPAEQWKKKIILKTELPFPHVSSRIPISANREEVILSPIQNAIEAISTKVKALKLLLSRNPVDVKALQQVLQGILLVTVNAGPIAFKEAFLSDKNIGNYPPEETKRLKFLILEELLSVCKQALEVNREIMEVTQSEFQNALTEGYMNLHAALMGKASTFDLRDSSGNRNSLTTSSSSQIGRDPLLANVNIIRDSAPASPTAQVRHNFKTKTFLSPTYCAQCTKFIYGVAKQGQWCEDCHFPVHDNCVADVPSNCSRTHQKWDKKYIKSSKELLTAPSANDLNLESHTVRENPYASLVIRLNSFETRWDHPTITMDYLAVSGFYYEPTEASPDLCKCYSCEITISNLSEDDDPLEMHKKLFPECEYLNNITQEEMVSQYNYYISTLKERIQNKKED